MTCPKWIELGYLSETDRTKCTGKYSNRSRGQCENLGKHTKNLSLVLKTLVLNNDRLSAEKGKVTLANKPSVEGSVKT